MTPLVRVPALTPLSPAQLTAAMIVGEGWNYGDGARLMGVEYSTFVSHVVAAGAKLPGDLPPRLRVIAWWRGASAEVLGVRATQPTRSSTLSHASTVCGWRTCPYCGNVAPHAEPTAGGDIRSS